MYLACWQQRSASDNRVARWLGQTLAALTGGAGGAAVERGERRPLEGKMAHEQRVEQEAGRENIGRLAVVRRAVLDDLRRDIMPGADHVAPRPRASRAAEVAQQQVPGPLLFQAFLYN